MARQGVDLLVVFPRWMPGDALFVANLPGVVLFTLDGGPTLIGRGVGPPRLMPAG